MKIETYKLNGERHTDITAYISDTYRVIGKKESRPAVLICPGGAFFSLSEREGEPVAVSFLNRGFQAFVLHYTIGDPEKGFVDIMEDALTDCAEAVRFIKIQAETFGIDKEQVIAMGFSAGGYLAAMYGSRCGEAWLMSKIGAAGQELKIKAVILCYAMCDMEVMYEYEDRCTVPVRELLLRANLCLCGEEKPSVERRKKYSPYCYVNKETPPTFLWHTSDDEMIPASNSLTYAGKLMENNIPCELHIFQQGVHGMSLALPHTAAKDEEINRYCAGWFEMLMKWLEERILL